MNATQLAERLREVVAAGAPAPGAGRTQQRHELLFALGREDLTLARLAEAHLDAVAILAEAGRAAQPGALYGVWAAEAPSARLVLLSLQATLGQAVDGSKVFCSGAGLVDRALVTVAAPQPYLVEVDLRAHPEALRIDRSSWQTTAFALTDTATVHFDRLPVGEDAIIGERDWYLTRPGFWHGACGPAACWAGGAAGLVDFAMRQSRKDAHTLAHLGAMHALVWQMQECLAAAGREMDDAPCDIFAAHRRALTVRHLVEQACTEILRHFARAYGPHPLACEAAIAQRYHELDLYLRQCHAERDLEALGRLLHSDAR